MTDKENPGKLIWHVSCDESGTGGQRFYGFGSLWMKYQRRGDFVQIIRELREKHNCSDELKWQKAHSKQNAEFYEDVIEAFLNISGLRFIALLFKKRM